MRHRNLRKVETTLDLDYDGDEITAHVSGEYDPGETAEYSPGDGGCPGSDASIDGVKIVIEFDALPVWIQDRIHKELMEQAKSDAAERRELTER